eukprot:MONOS_1992.1-p1 / transcript=MONOS_1992.1 / gene=MONOS_1992 / organism=Monocercomonoides_exilis_PA203 / gene_product=unspecified product / transcript_product=unspecified product / location=Mono_scaffold00038:104758-105665(-) / protein_length=194 / sequence_SO=supercontig / SO=protein_coding / is_pseudo=false
MTILSYNLITLEYYTVQSFVWVYIYFAFSVSYGRQILDYTEPQPFDGEMKLNGRDYLTYIFSILGLAGGGTAMVGFWAFLFPLFSAADVSGWTIFWDYFTPHGMSFIFIVIDILCLSRVQFKIAHCIIPLVMVFTYLGFAMIYYSIHKIYIYPFLDLSTEGAWVAWVSLSLFPSIVSAAMWLLQIIRGKIFSK